MKNVVKRIFVLLFVFALVLVPIKSNAFESPCCNDLKCNEAICNLKMSERKLWLDHVSWTRSFIISDLASLEDKNDVVKRLLKNQDDIGNSIKPYYGEEAGNKLALLLREHIQIGGQVVDSAKAGNKDDLDKYNKIWYENADRIAHHLNSINPNYSYETIKDMLYKHLQLVTDQVVARLSKDWKKDIDAYDKNEDHMIMFADVLTNGIIKQCTKNFKN